MLAEPPFSHPDPAVLADELFRPDVARLDEVLRVAVLERLRGLVTAIAGLIAPEMAEGAYPRLRDAGLLAYPPLVRELIDAATLARLNAALLPTGSDDPDAPGLLPRLAGDPATAEPATALLLAGGGIGQAGLPAEIHEWLVWTVAATATDRDPSEIETTARRALAAHDEGARAEAAATRLALALVPDPATIAEAVGARQLTLAVALLARGLKLPFDVARGVVINPAGDHLWLGLRALDATRATLATIAAALATADPRRDLEAFAARLDDLVVVTPDEARARLAQLRLPDAFHAAAAALAR